MAQVLYMSQMNIRTSSLQMNQTRWDGPRISESVSNKEKWLPGGQDQTNTVLYVSEFADLN